MDSIGKQLKTNFRARLLEGDIIVCMCAGSIDSLARKLV
jgi:hypothetical protein